MKNETIETGFRLSPQQRRRWDPYRASNYKSKVSANVMIYSEMDTLRLNGALQKLTLKYEILRTRFPIPAGMVTPVQVVSICAFDPKKSDARDVALTINPTRVKADQFRLEIAISPLCGDFRTLQLLGRELVDLYEGQTKAPDSDVIQYAVISEWLNNILEPDCSDEGRLYWKEASSAASLHVRHPFESLSGNAQEYNIIKREYTLPEATFGTLKNVAINANVTMETVFLAAWSIILARYNDKLSVVIGTVFDGREKQIQSVIGVLEREVPILCEIGPNLSLGNYLSQLAFSRSQAEEWQFYFDWKDNGGRDGYFQYGFNYIRLDDVIFQNRYKFHIESGDSAGERHDLSLDCFEGSGKIKLSLSFDSNRFTDRAVDIILSHLVKILSSILDVTADVASLSSLPDDERSFLLKDLGSSASDYSAKLSIVPEFERLAALYSDRIAVVSSLGEISYSELNDRANQLAAKLVAHGVSEGAIVAVIGDRSLNMVTAVIGILKAGAAYLPLLPNYPTARIEFILRDAGCHCVLVENTKNPDFLSNYTILGLNDELLYEGVAANPSRIIAPHDLAYVIYTSGSSGAPKGVMIEHCQLFNLVNALDEIVYSKLERPVNIAMVAPIVFDPSVQQMFGALVLGNTLFIVPEGIRNDGPELVRFLEDKSIHVSDGTPAHLSLMASELPGSAKKLSLKVLLIGGEAMPLDLVRMIQTAFREHPRPRLINLYGPTECTVDATFQVVELDEINGGSYVAIGRPIPNCATYVLDDHCALVPSGVIGELYIGGAGVGRGYLHNDELTFARYMDCPFKSKTRMYRTGDLVRWSWNGALEFIGRADEQVKIRGFRVELGEIESALRALPGVRIAAASVYQDEDGHKALSGYIEADRPLLIADVRAQLAARLADYMMPVYIMQVATMPVTVNGKVDKKALPKPINAGSGSEFAPPIGEVEIKLAQIWKEVLKCDRVGRNDDFFSIGGDSIRCLQVRANSRKAGLDFTVRQLFEERTVRRLSNVVRSSRDVVPIEDRGQKAFRLLSEAERNFIPSNSEDAYPVTRLQLGMILHNQCATASSAYQDTISMHLELPFDEGAVQTSLRELLLRHPVLRTSFRVNGCERPLQIVERDVIEALTCFDIRILSEIEQDVAIRSWLGRQREMRFDIEKAPLWRVCIHRRSDSTLQFTLINHHAIVDGWSVAILITELVTLYKNLLRGNELSSTKNGVLASFSSFVEAELRITADQASRKFWDKELRDLPIFARRQVGPKPGSIPGKVRSPIDTDVLRKLHSLARAENVSIKSIFLAVHLYVLGFVTNQKEAVTGLGVNGRSEDEGGDRILGLFLNTAPFRIECSTGTWGELIRRVAAKELEIYPHRMFPLFDIQQSLMRDDLFSTAFNYLNFHIYQEISGENINILGYEDYEESSIGLVSTFIMGGANAELILRFDGVQSDETYAKRIAHYYMAALRAVAMGLNSELRTVNLLTEAEMRQLLKGRDENLLSSQGGRTIIELFDNQVFKTPHATAIRFRNGSLSFIELSRKVNRLGRLLRNRGIGKGDIVAIAVDRCSELLVGVLGILRAGSAFLPVDPMQPDVRVTQMLENSEASCVLTKTEFLMRPWAGKATLDLNDDRTFWCSSEPIIPVGSPEDLAYVIYTSGSSGEPKAVMIENCSVVNYLVWLSNALNYDTSDVFLQKTSASFDPSVMELLLGPITGACTAILPREEEMDPAKILAAIYEYNVTTIVFVPSEFNVFLKIAGKGLCGGPLKRIICGGEALGSEQSKMFFALASTIKLYNFYGPTETTIAVSCHEVKSGEECIPLGDPCANCWLLLLDEDLKLVPIEADGEIYIGGIQLARGYLKDPKLTNARFVIDPYRGDRLYRTGDRARRLADGRLQFVSRIDAQVKIRGYRIELGEIESALSRCRNVSSSAVKAFGKHGDLAICAYIVGNSELEATRCREELATTLPAYMMPTYFVILDEMPLTRSGKLDRAALAEPLGKPILAGPFRAAQNAIEAALIEVWEEVLGEKGISVDQNLFEIGAHSLNVMTAHWKIQQKLDKKFAIVDFFKFPTVARLAENFENGTVRITALEAQVTGAQRRRAIKGDVKERSAARKGFRSGEGANAHSN